MTSELSLTYGKQPTDAGQLFDIHSLLMFWSHLWGHVYAFRHILISSCNVTTFSSVQSCIYLLGESGCCVGSSQAHAKIITVVKVWTLSWLVHVWKLCLMLPEPQFHNLSVINRGIVILEYARAIREVKNQLMEKPVHSVYSGSQLTSCFGHIVLLILDLPTEATPDHNTTPQGLYGRHQALWVHHFIGLYSYPDTPSLCNRVNLQYLVQYLCSLASLIRFKATVMILVFVFLYFLFYWELFLPLGFYIYIYIYGMSPWATTALLLEFTSNVFLFLSLTCLFPPHSTCTWSPRYPCI